MASTDLVSLADVKLYIAVNASNTDYDDVLEDMIDSASEAIEQYCRLKFALSQRTEYHDGDGGSKFFTKVRPITDATGTLLETPTAATITVWVDTDRAYGDDYKVDNEDLIVWPAEGKIGYDGGNFTEGDKSIKVTYYSGYATIPTDVQEAAKMLVQDWWIFRSYRQQSELGGEGPLPWDLGGSGARLPGKVRALLSPYVRHETVFF